MTSLMAYKLNIESNVQMREYFTSTTYEFWFQQDFKPIFHEKRDLEKRKLGKKIIIQSKTMSWEMRN